MGDNFQALGGHEDLDRLLLCQPNNDIKQAPERCRVLKRLGVFQQRHPLLGVVYGCSQRSQIGDEMKCGTSAVTELIDSQRRLVGEPHVAGTTVLPVRRIGDLNGCFSQRRKDFGHPRSNALMPIGNGVVRPSCEGSGQMRSGSDRIIEQHPGRIGLCSVRCPDGKPIKRVVHSPAIHPVWRPEIVPVSIAWLNAGLNERRRNHAGVERFGLGETEEGNLGEVGRREGGAVFFPPILVAAAPGEIPPTAHPAREHRS